MVARSGPAEPAATGKDASFASRRCLREATVGQEGALAWQLKRQIGTRKRPFNLASPISTRVVYCSPSSYSAGSSSGSDGTYPKRNHEFTCATRPLKSASSARLLNMRWKAPICPSVSNLLHPREKCFHSRCNLRNFTCSPRRRTSGLPSLNNRARPARRSFTLISASSRISGRVSGRSRHMVDQRMESIIFVNSFTESIASFASSNVTW